MFQRVKVSWLPSKSDALLKSSKLSKVSNINSKVYLINMNILWIDFIYYTQVCEKQNSFKKLLQ